MCYRCGEKFDSTRIRTSHHSIPKNLNPKYNIQIPVCEDCHDEINSSNIASLTNYAYKLLKQARSLESHVRILTNVLENSILIGIKNKTIKEKEPK